jgi:endonuclease YncB( thermonuclease family)
MTTIDSDRRFILRFLVTSLLFVFLTANMSSAESIRNKVFGNAMVAEVTSIYDGDTFRCNIAGYPEIIGERIGIRVAGVDTPEMRDNRPHIKKLAQKAKQFAVARLRSGERIELRNMKRGKYFRIVAEVYIGGKDLGQELIAAGLAQPYDGGRKSKWQ